MTGIIECPCCAERFEYDLEDIEVTCPDCGTMFCVNPEGAD